MFTNTYVPHVGGVARSVSCFEEDLRKLGHRVLIVAPTFHGTPKNENRDFVLRVPAIQNFNGSDFSAGIPSPFLIHQKMDEFQPDVIHSHHPYLLGDTAMRVAGRNCLPIVFTHHTLYEEYAHYVLSSAPMKKFVTRLSTAYANCCTHVIAPSRSIADLIKKRGVTKPVSEIPTGIDFESFQKGDGKRFRKAQGIGDDTQLIGHVGRLAREKNLGFLTKAVTIALKQNKKAKFLVVGDGPDRKQIEKVFAENHLTDRLILAGKITGNDLANAYCAMDVFVFSSKSETQGLVVAEAMAAGKPVIAIDASGVREVVSDNENGRLLPQDASPEAFSEAVTDFFQKPDDKNRWQENALSTARRFDRAKMAGTLSDLYEHVLQQQLTGAEEHKGLIRSWENLLHGIRTEWDLLSGKVGAIAEAVKLENNDRSSGT